MDGLKADGKTRLKDAYLKHQDDALLIIRIISIGIIANAAVVFVTFIVALVSYIAPLNRLWLRLHSWLVILSGMFTLILGLIIWFYTLKSRSNIGKIWTDESDEVRSLLQQRVCSFSLSLTLTQHKTFPTRCYFFFHPMSDHRFTPKNPILTCSS